MASRNFEGLLSSHLSINFTNLSRVTVPSMKSHLCPIYNQNMQPRIIIYISNIREQKDVLCNGGS